MKKKTKIILGIGLAVLLLVVAGAVIYYVQVVQKEQESYETYLEAFELYKEGKYEKAEKLLLSTKDYGETETILTDLYYMWGVELFEKEEYEKARELFLKNPDYQDTADYLKETAYQLGMAAYNDEDYDTAEAFFEEISGYKDIQNYIEGIAYGRLQIYFAEGNFDKAGECLLSIRNMDGVQPYGIVLLPTQAQKAFENLEYERSMELYECGLGYAAWVENVYNNLPDEQKASEYGSICGEVPYEERLKQMEEAYLSVKKEHQAVECLKHLISYYEEKMKDKAVFFQADEIRVAMQAYAEDNIVPVVMIAYQETVMEKKKEVQRQAYAAYNDANFYAICHSLDIEEIDKSNADEVQANLRITQYWNEKDTITVDMSRIRRAMGWE